MTEAPKKRRKPRRPSINPAQETVDFSAYPELHEFVKERATLNVRTVSQEILFRLQAAMRSIQAGKKGKEI